MTDTNPENTSNIETNQTEQTQQQPEGESISGLVNAELTKQLIEMGFTKNASEKALFLNKNSLELSIEWMYEHQNDADFNEELRIVGRSAEEVKTMTPEEIAKKAKEISELASKRYKEKQKKLEEDQEKFRIQQTRELAKAKREIEEAEIRRYAEIKKNQKIEAEREKKRMLEQLARDKEERFGKKFDANTGQVKTEVSDYDNAVHYIKSIKTLFPTFRDGDKAKNCLSLIKTMIGNIIKSPTEEKFRKVKLSNNAFQERVGKILLAMKCMGHLGFKEDGEYFACGNPDIDLLQKVFNVLDEELKSYNN